MKRKPAYVKTLEGNRSKQPIGYNVEPDPLRDLSAPDYLTGIAKEEWDRVAPILSELGLLTDLDVALLASYCVAYATWRKAEQILDEQGLTFCITRDDGSLYCQQRPEESIANKMLTQIKAICSEFGMSPGARARMELPMRPKTDGSDLSALLD